MLLEHRAAINLNNTGISLMQKDCHEGGLNTLLDALTAMNKAFEKVTVLEAAQDDQDVTQMLHGAAQQLAQACIGPKDKVPKNMTIVSDECDPSGLGALPKDTPILLKIESMVDSCGTTSVDFDLHSSCLLYNYGMAFRINSQDQSGALRYFHMSYSLLADSCNSSKELDEVTLRRVVLTATLVLQSLVTLSDKLGLTADRDEYLERLEYMRKSAEDLKKRPTRCNSRSKAARAA